METVKNAGNFVAEKVQSATSGASKETNKNVAKDNNAPIGTRLESGVDALQDKAEEKKHDAKGEGHKQAAMH